MLNMKPCPIYNFHSYFLHVITAHNMGKTQGKFHNSSDYDLNTLRSYYPSIILLIVIGEEWVTQALNELGK